MITYNPFTISKSLHLHHIVLLSVTPITARVITSFVGAGSLSYRNKPTINVRRLVRWLRDTLQVDPGISPRISTTNRQRTTPSGLSWWLIRTMPYDPDQMPNDRQSRHLHFIIPCATHGKTKHKDRHATAVSLIIKTPPSNEKYLIVALISQCSAAIPSISIYLYSVVPNRYLFVRPPYS
jgi:hypothetical protein